MYGREYYCCVRLVLETDYEVRPFFGEQDVQQQQHCSSRERSCQNLVREECQSTSGLQEGVRPHHVLPPPFSGSLCTPHHVLPPPFPGSLCTPPVHCKPHLLPCTLLLLSWWLGWCWLRGREASGSLNSIQPVHRPSLTEGASKQHEPRGLVVARVSSQAPHPATASSRQPGQEPVSRQACSRGQGSQLHSTAGCWSARVGQEQVK